MEWLADPTIWMGLATLVVLEIILGIDNLVFIAILVDKLPPGQRDKARLIGLSLALIMRLGLLLLLSWIMKLTAPLFEIMGKGFSGRDLILIFGGAFLLFKATMELHERLEGESHSNEGNKVYAGFGLVIAQIVVLDAVFSLDSVITAVGMVEHLPVMATAVIIAVGVMMLASKPLTNFVNKHATVVILCLGFLLMIGFSLVVEGLGFKIPKGYLYAAIVFSIMVEGVNQWSRFKRESKERTQPLRQRTTDAVLRLLGANTPEAAVATVATDDVVALSQEPGLELAERDMVRSVLSLAERPITSLMTVRADIVWLDTTESTEQVVAHLRESVHTRLLVCDGELDKLHGVVQTRDLLADLLGGKELSIAMASREPLYVPESSSILHVLGRIREHAIPLAVVVNEYGGVEGLVTANDLLAVIAGDLVDTHDVGYAAQVEQDGAWIIDGAMALEDAERVAGLVFVRNPAYTTLSGLILYALDRMPEVGDCVEVDSYKIEVLSLQRRRVYKARVVAIQ